MADELNPQEAIAEEALSPSEDVEPESFPAAAGDGVPEPEAVPESIETAEPEVTDGDPAAEVETEAPVEAAGAGEESEPANVDDDAAAAAAAAAAEIPPEGEPAEGDEEGGEPAKAVEGEEAAPPEGAEPAGEAVEIAADDTNVSEAVEADVDTAAPVEGAVESEEKDVSVVETETTPLLEDAPMQVDSLQEEQGAIQQDEDEESIDLFAAEELLIMPQYNREELLQKYQAAVTEREQLSARNSAVQHKLAEFFRKKKTEEARHDVDKNVADQEQRYVKYMSNLEELRKQLVEEQTTYREHLDELKERKVDKQAKVEEEWKKSSEFKKAVATASINSRSGRPIPAKDIEQYEINERKKEAEVSQVRLENIKLKNKLNKQEMQLKQKEELAEGLHLIDFEQLKIENQTYNEKIEERNEELLKLRKKITNTVQVLTHLKEKLQFVQAENQVKKQKLLVVEQDVARKRDILSRTKQARDALRHDNSKLQQKCGLLGNTDLLRDFENTTDEGDDLRHRLEQLKRLHAELTLNLNGVKKKIELAKENQP